MRFANPLRQKNVLALGLVGLLLLSTTGCSRHRHTGALIGAVIGAGVGYVIANESDRGGHYGHRGGYHSRRDNVYYRSDPYYCD